MGSSDRPSVMDGWPVLPRAIYAERGDERIGSVMVPLLGDTLS